MQDLSHEKGPEEDAVWRNAIKSLKQHAVQILRDTVGPVGVRWATQTELRELREMVKWYDGARRKQWAQGALACAAGRSKEMRR